MTSVEIDDIMAFLLRLCYRFILDGHTQRTDTHWPSAICRQRKNKLAPPCAPSPENSVINEWHWASGFRPLQSIFQMIDTCTFHALRQLNATAQERATRENQPVEN